MIQFILDSKPFTQTDRDDLIPYYLSLGCIQVPKLYNDNDSFINPIWNGTEFIESATPEEIAEQQQTERKVKETELYKKRTQDGINAYAEISAEFRLAKLSGTITEEAHAHIERMLTPVRNEILAGQWMSGLKELELIGSELIGQQLYNRLHLQISNYINENY